MPQTRLSMKKSKHLPTAWFRVSTRYVSRSHPSPIRVPINSPPFFLQRFAPIVDFFEIQVNKLNSETVPRTPSSNSQYQYQRAYALSRNLTENIYVYSNEHLKQLQAQNVLVYVCLLSFILAF